MYNKYLSNAVLVLGVLAHSSTAYFRMSCSQIQVARIDPIVNPNSLSPHAHKISGPSNIGPDSTYTSLQSANCTSCEIQADKSAYWTPTFYYQHANGSFQEVPNGGMTVYYLGRGDNRTEIVPFPPGFRMVSGDTSLRAYSDTPTTYLNARPVAERVSFACLDTLPKGETHIMNDTSCANGLRAQIHFQSCWDGVNLYKADNSHVAYMSGIDNGVCPPTHPKPLIHLFFEVLYGVADIQQSAGGKFVFSNGDGSGTGFHGDFLNGWDEDVLKAAIKECVNEVPDMIDSCAPLQPSHVKDTVGHCPLAKPFSQEPMRGLIDKLPGCAKVSEGNESVVESGCPGEGNGAVPVNGTAPVNGTVRRVRRGGFV
ncbi:hypothetical protein G7Y79_00050g085840 [Physcia stellaris]|nr:hypothetical protein G7Y79_00050g085840 [Physcia stellaris]